MSESYLVSYEYTQHQKSNPRKNAKYNPSGRVTKITIHHMAGNLTMDDMKNIIKSPSRDMSCNYAIDSNGRVGLFVPENRRSWCSSSRPNDFLAVTIEVANDQIGGQWHVSDKALSTLIELCTDICRRNGISALDFTGDKNGNLTMHNYFISTACPGPYLSSKFPYIAAEVNKELRLGDAGIQAGDTCQVKAGSPQYGSSDAKAPSQKETPECMVVITKIKPGAPHPYHGVGAGDWNKDVYGWLDASSIEKLSEPEPSKDNPRDTANWDAEGNDFVVTASKGDRAALRKVCTEAQLPIRNA